MVDEMGVLGIASLCIDHDVVAERAKTTEAAAAASLTATLRQR